ncbi:unnamed protein product [Symbiodinium sp. CCMP2592]|nr:unnamed protein product [Symbiodinium sp. CCMP2592]
MGGQLGVSQSAETGSDTGAATSSSTAELQASLKKIHVELRDLRKQHKFQQLEAEQAKWDEQFAAAFQHRSTENPRSDLTEHTLLVARAAQQSVAGIKQISQLPSDADPMQATNAYFQAFAGVMSIAGPETAAVVGTLAGIVDIFAYHMQSRQETLTAAIAHMFRHAVDALKEHIDQQFAQQRLDDIRNRIEGSMQLLRVINSTCDGFRAEHDTYNMKERERGLEDLTTTFRTFSANVRKDLATLKNYILSDSSFSNFYGPRYGERDSINCYPTHLHGHHELNCKKLQAILSAYVEISDAYVHALLMLQWTLALDHELGFRAVSDNLHHDEDAMRIELKGVLATVISQLLTWANDRNSENWMDWEYIDDRPERTLIHAAAGVTPAGSGKEMISVDDILRLQYQVRVWHSRFDVQQDIRRARTRADEFDVNMYDATLVAVKVFETDQCLSFIDDSLRTIPKPSNGSTDDFFDNMKFKLVDFGDYVGFQSPQFKKWMYVNVESVCVCDGRSSFEVGLCPVRGNPRNDVRMRFQVVTFGASSYAGLKSLRSDKWLAPADETGVLQCWRRGKDPTRERRLRWEVCRLGQPEKMEVPAILQ